MAQVRLARVIPSMHVHLCVASWLFSPRLSCPLLRPTVLLPALPDVYLRVQREVQVQPPVRLPLGDRGLSTLQRLKQKAEGDPQVPTYFYRNQQWAQSSSSTWWNWQGSWWTPCPYEIHGGDAPSTDRKE